MVQPGDKVRHKRYKYGVGEVKSISKSGKRAYVKWPELKSERGYVIYFAFSAYYGINSLVKE